MKVFSSTRRFRSLFPHKWIQSLVTNAWILKEQNKTKCSYNFLVILNIYSFTKCPIHPRDVNTPRLHFFTATYYLFTLTQEIESGLMRCAGPPQQLMHFHAALTCVRALYDGEAGGDTVPTVRVGRRPGKQLLVAAQLPLALALLLLPHR